MDTPSIGSLDREVALARMGGDEELLKEIAALFLENYQDWLRDLRQATARGDALMVERTAHGLKGSVANFGARNAVEASLNLEHLGRTRDLAGATESLAALEVALETLRGDLESL
ncbi:MAG TPA: Hpt domain-containing protein [Bryobacteraceae bacterium]|jgi:HPt (histidine-containing phosphotransfer) domain-containing protein